MTEISQKFDLIEPSLADALILIENDPLLTPSRKTQWACSIRRIAVWIDRPLETLPARVTALRQPIERLNSARLGVAQKTLANQKSNLRAGLNYLSGQGLTLARGVALSPEWQILMDGIQDPWARTRLYAFFRFASARGLKPEEMTDEVLAAHFEHRRETTFHKVTPSVRRETARAWNKCVGDVQDFPSVRLTVEELKPRFDGPDWEDFPKGFRDEVEGYLTSLKKPHRSVSGRRWKGCKASTIRTRRAEILAAARKMVRLGKPVDNFNSLRDLLEPEIVRELLDAYWEQCGERPTNYVIDLAWKLNSIARHTDCLTPEELAELDDMRVALEEHRRPGLTEKNLAVVRAVLAGSIWAKAVQLPDRLMADARKLKTKSQMKAAVLAQVAVAIRILTFAPVRIGNLVNISLETNLIRPNGLEGPYWLEFPSYHVKNGTDLTYPLSEEVTKFIELYIHEFRPVLLRGSNTPLLFPGGKGDGAAKLTTTLSEQIAGLTDRELGLRITAHQFRNAAAAIILKDQPGNYELVRRVLGHTNIQTSVSSYIGLETIESSKQFGEMIQKHMSVPKTDG
jgi:integrase